MNTKQCSGAWSHATIGAVGALLCAAGAASAQQQLELDPMLGWVVRGGVGEGRAVYFTAEETFEIRGASFFANMPVATYEVVIYEGAGEFAAPGPILARNAGTLGGIGRTWNDIAIAFTFRQGSDYILSFRGSAPGTTVATEYERVFWGDDPGEDLNIGLVTLRDGREGYDAENFSNVAFPRMRVELAPSCYPDCDTASGAGVLDIFDFLCFQDLFVQGDPYACDCDTASGPGVCDIFDFLCFQDAFVRGCP